MPFQIPNHDADSLKLYSAAALNDMRNIAAAEFNEHKATITAARDAETVADTEVLTRSDELYAFVAAVDTHLDEVEAAVAATVTASAREIGARAVKTVTTVDTVTETAPAETGEAVTAAATVATVAVVNAASVAEIANTGSEQVVKATRKAYTITAAAETGYAAGQELGGIRDITAAFIERTRAYGGASKGGRGSDAMQHTVAKVTRHYEEGKFLEPGMGKENIYALTEAARDEKKLPGGSLLQRSLTAGIGWCAPSETIYSTCSQITATGLLDLPTIGARRGGIRHNRGIDFSTIFGGGTGYNILTEAQVIADTVKTCVQIPCPEFVDDRLKVAALCLTGDLLQNVGYPEFVNTFIDGAIAAQAHNVNRDIIATIVAGSTAVNLSTVDPWVTDGSVVSQVMSAAELAVMDIRYRLRLDPGATIEMGFPLWLPAQMRADWIRRNGPMDPDLVDAKIASMFATRGVRPQYVYDWQDAFSGLTTTGPGAATPLLALPSTPSAVPTFLLQFLAYPAGTWLLAQEDVIRLDSVYDSTLLATNKVTQLFIEEGYLPMRMCPLSRVYSVNICPNGSTGVQRAVACTDVTP